MKECENCKFVAKRELPNYSSQGTHTAYFCHRYPPVHQPTFLGEWPQVHPKSWCGEWKSILSDVITD